MSDAELLGLVSFYVLMEGGGGILNVAPSYMFEKARLLKSPFDMYSALDDMNSKKVLEWGKLWGIDFDSLIKQMQKDYWDIPSTDFRVKYKGGEYKNE